MLPSVLSTFQVAVDFSVWAFKPQEQREHEARLQAHIQAEAAASQRMALVSCVLLGPMPVPCHHGARTTLSPNKTFNEAQMFQMCHCCAQFVCTCSSWHSHQAIRSLLGLGILTASLHRH